MKEVIRQLTMVFEANIEEPRATKMSGYMKGNFEFFGIYAELRRSLVNGWYATNKTEIQTDLKAIVWSLWSLDQREYQYAAMDIMAKNIKQFGQEDIAFVKQLIVHVSWWDSVDWISSWLLGRCLSYDKKLQYDICENWIIDPNMWIRRSVIIHQLKYKDRTDQELLFALITATIGSKEFFINKASGWALRQYSKYNAAAVSEFIDNHPQLSNLTKREGSKYL